MASDREKAGPAPAGEPEEAPAPEETVMTVPEHKPDGEVIEEAEALRKAREEAERKVAEAEKALREAQEALTKVSG